ncbi:MAG: hypothetical protein SFY32_00670 [Bacteroidota bacterium]|nr:hypothetical protein [Bacteroidota bacterium]
MSYVIKAQSSDDLSGLDRYAENSSQDGLQGQSFILMHNRKGIRIEYNLNRKKLEMWVSPLAGKSNIYIDRNFSSRDDFTKLFDKISFPNLPYSQFEKCDYDPFHSIIYYKNGQKLHIVSVFDKPAVIIWFEKPEVVDIKTDKQDKLLKFDPKNLSTQHPDRGKILGYIASLGTGEGSFIHQKHYDPFRSFYSRAYLSANQTMVFVGDDISENVSSIANVLAFADVNTTLEANKTKIIAATRNGKITVKNNPDLQKILDINKKVLLSMQDESGAIRAALRYIYYMIWHRDGAMVNAFNGYSGWTNPLKDWTGFELSNPTVIEKNGKKERFFGQLVAGKITKLEEDGPFYGIWSAFTYWTSTGDTKYLDGKYMSVLEDNIQWLENNYFDNKNGLFYRYHYCESPFYNSYGDGWDDAMGAQTGKNISRWKGDTITQAYDLYMNYICYSSYLMMSAMESGSMSGLYLLKAKNLEKRLTAQFNNVEPGYGTLITTQNQQVNAGPFGMDKTDYVWGLTVPPFYPSYENLAETRSNLFKHHMNKPKGNFYPEWFSTLISMDSEIHKEEDIIKGIEYVIPQCIKPGKCLPMPYTICEIVDVEDCNVYHDVRPQAFSISAFIAAVSNLAIKKLPFGIAIRGTSYLSGIEDYTYQQSEISIKYLGTGNNIKLIKLNGKVLKSTYQIPDNLLLTGKNQIEVTLSTEKESKPTLIYSTLKLKNIQGNKFEMQAFGKNVIMMKNINSLPKLLFEGKEIIYQSQVKDGITYIDFEGVGVCNLVF